jgi:hypothetical protein
MTVHDSGTEQTVKTIGIVHRQDRKERNDMPEHDNKDRTALAAQTPEWYRPRHVSHDRTFGIEHLDTAAQIGQSGSVGSNCAGLGSQCCDVVLVRGRINLGKPQGVGISEWETDGEQMGRDGNDWISL